MKRWPLGVFLMLVLVACHHRPKTPEEAYLRLERAVAAGDAEALYELLDKQTRWAVLSAYNDQRLQRTIISAKYPEREAQAALARLQAAEEASAPRYFARVCRDRQLLEPARQLLGASNQPFSVEHDRPNECLVKRPSAGAVRLHRDLDGTWGWGDLGIVWELERDRASHAVKTVRDNAALYQKAESQ
jgi:hypothetical protein